MIVTYTENRVSKMDNNSESSDCKSVYESSDTEYDSDNSVSHGFSSESEIDFDESSYVIPTNPITQAPNLGKLTQTPWSQVTKSENGNLDFQFDSSASGAKHIPNCDKPIDLFYLRYSLYSRPVLESKGMHGIFQKKCKKGKIFENLGKKCTKFENILKRAASCM